MGSVRPIQIGWLVMVATLCLAGTRYTLGALDVDDATNRGTPEGLTGPFAVMATYDVGQNREVLAALEESLRQIYEEDSSVLSLTFRI